MDAIAASIIGGTLLTGGVGNIFGTLFGVLASGIVLLIVTAIGSQDPWWPQITRAAISVSLLYFRALYVPVRKHSSILLVFVHHIR